MKDEKKKTSDQTTREKSDEELADEVLDKVAGGRSVIITNDPPARGNAMPVLPGAMSGRPGGIV